MRVVSLLRIPTLIMLDIFSSISSNYRLQQFIFQDPTTYGRLMRTCKMFQTTIQLLPLTGSHYVLLWLRRLRYQYKNNSTLPRDPCLWQVRHRGRFYVFGGVLFLCDPIYPNNSTMLRHEIFVCIHTGIVCVQCQSDSSAQSALWQYDPSGSISLTQNWLIHGFVWEAETLMNIVRGSPCNHHRCLKAELHSRRLLSLMSIPQLHAHRMSCMS